MTKQLISNAALERALKQTRTIPIQATNVSFSVEVPGGGDYSNMNLSIGQGGDDTPLQVQYDLPAPGTSCLCPSQRTYDRIRNAKHRNRPACPRLAVDPAINNPTFTLP